MLAWRRFSSAPVVAGLVTAAACAENSPEPLTFEVEVRLHDGQPMVADLVVATEDELDLEAEHEADPGVVGNALELDSGEVGLRVRGLSPDTDHVLTVYASAPNGREGEATIEFTTGSALPGFVERFDVVLGDEEAVDPAYRLFDLTDQPESQTSGLFQIDGGGQTRWYLGETLDVIGPSRIWIGAKLRDDGSVLFLLEHQVVILDELGEEQLRISAEQLGVPYLHHDVIELPNGNFIAISNSFRDIDYGAEGVLPVAGDLLVEFTPAGEVVWTWDTFDHLDPQRRREGFFGTFPILHPETGEQTHDWTHGNGIVYREEDDSISFSMRHQDWVISIDHETGEVNWRLGDEGDFELQSGSWFFHQHSPEWQPNGDILLYDNGLANPELADEDERSRVVSYAIDVAAGTATQTWEYGPSDFLAPVAGDADRMPTGNVLVLDSSLFLDMPAFDDFFSQLREVDEDAEEVWSLTTPVGRFAYRAQPTSRLVGEPLEP